MADLKSILKPAFPFISAALGLGGPFGTMAATALGAALGVSKVNPAASELEDAFAKATPDQVIAAKKAEQDFSLQMQQLNFQNAEDIEKLADADRASARGREVSLRDYTTRVLAYVIVAAFVAMVWAVLFRKTLADSVLAGTVIGYLSAKCEQVVSYYFGSSAGSDRKTELLSGAKQ